MLKNNKFYFKLNIFLVISIFGLLIGLEFTIKVLKKIKDVDLILSNYREEFVKDELDIRLVRLWGIIWSIENNFIV
ncbi:unnamed protein product [Meloidogyne enterolobii]|uniref:Uncharacterized protein n=1 Tax=Meloidogyne enterolobii TaxID=390850 RepID=A0ACB1A665_MELEN